jgi:hypothetical protein
MRSRSHYCSALQLFQAEVASDFSKMPTKIKVARMRVTVLVGVVVALCTASDVDGLTDELGVFDRCSVEENIDYSGNDITPLKKRDAANASECCDLCVAFPGCAAWSLQPAKTCNSKTNCCYLKTSTSGRRSYDGVISGTNSAAASCSSAMDCSLGGVCTNGSCVCDATFTGPNCVQLNLKPASKVDLWDRGNDTASWGGNVVYDKADGKWHLFFAEFLNHCPLGSWGTNSVVSQAIADEPQGPFMKKETVLPAFHHNPTIAYDPSTSTFLLVSIGNGSATPKNCSKQVQDETQAPQVSDPAAAGIITLSYASSANGPWTLMPSPMLEGRPNKWDAFVTNPSLYIFDNGTVLMAYRGG